MFVIPSITWVAISLLALIADVEDPVTLWDIIIVDIVIIYLWFLISLIITLIVWKVRKNKQQKLEKNNFMTKEEIKEPKIEIEKSEKVKEINYLTKKDEKIVVKNEEPKEDNKKKKKDKLLYTCESIVDGYENRLALKHFPELGMKTYIVYIMIATIFSLIVFAIILVLSKKVIIAVIVFAIIEIYLIVYFKLTLGKYLEKSFDAQIKKSGAGTEIHTEFYDDYLIRTKENITFKCYYADITKSVETDTNFYLKDSKNNLVIFLQKNRCSLELINFIREKFKNLENNLGETSKFKGVKKYHNPEFIKIFMIILFIITIMCLWGGLFLVSFINEIIPQHGFDFTKNTWGFWCLLPIPILSIILGFKYNKAGFKCTKNIVGGFIIGAYLLIYGSFCLLPTFSKDYSEINQYRNIIDAELPSNGVLEIQDWGTYFDNDKTNYTIINAYYDKENVENLVNSIENNPNWILSKEIKSELKIFIPSTLYSDDDAYYSIYNKTNGDYNTLPELEDKYEIYAMKYDIGIVEKKSLPVME